MTSAGETQRHSGAALAFAALALILCGAIAGFFYAYSSSVMRGLDATDPRAAISAMQGINATVRNAFFAPAFFGTPVASLISAGLFAAARRASPAAAMAAAAAIYLVGALALTFFINIPMNDALAGIDAPADVEEARRIWSAYSGPWTFWNHVRMSASFASLLLVGLAIYHAGKR